MDLRKDLFNQIIADRQIVFKSMDSKRPEQFPDSPDHLAHVVLIRQGGNLQNQNGFKLCEDFSESKDDYSCIVPQNFAFSRSLCHSWHNICLIQLFFFAFDG